MTAAQVAYFTSNKTRFCAMCLHLQMNSFVSRMQELILLHQAAVVHMVSGLCGSHNKWCLEFTGACTGPARLRHESHCIDQAYCIM